MQRSILLNPGPVTLSDKVRAAMTSADWCHREPEFAELTQWINDQLVRIYSSLQTDYASVILTGSGTCAVEAMIATFAPIDDKTLVVANGVYGERIASMLAAQGKPVVVVRSEATEAMDLPAVRECLQGDESIRYVATVQHETTTGRLNDLDGLGALCREFGVHMLLDAVSSFGAENIDAASWNVAALAGTANKCLHGVPGISFVIAHDSVWQADSYAGSVYLDLHRYYKSQHGDGFSPFTQSVQAAFALRAALEEFQEAGGWRARHSLYESRAAAIHESLTGAGIENLLPSDVYSTVLRSYRLPDGVSYTRIHDYLKDKGYIVYAGQGDLASTIFRIAHMGDIKPDELDTFCELVSSLFEARAQ